MIWHDYRTEAIRILSNNACFEKLESIVAELRNVKERNGRLFFIGNGGGQSMASHAAADYRKIAGIESYAWGDNVADLTAWVNDDGWGDSVIHWLSDSKISANDALFVFSVGGCRDTVSYNLARPIVMAKGAGINTFGVCGKGNNTLQESLLALVLDSDSTPHVEGLQAVLHHYLVNAV